MEALGRSASSVNMKEHPKITKKKIGVVCHRRLAYITCTRSHTDRDKANGTNFGTNGNRFIAFSCFIKNYREN